MTSFALVIGGHTVTGDTQYIGVKAEDMGVRVCEVILLNEGNEWDNDFEIKDAFNLDIDGVDFWDGYVDDVEPYRHPGFTDLPMIKVKAIDYTFDLAKLYHTEDYEEKPLDNIIDDALLDTSSEITYTSPGTAPNAPYEFNRTYLLEGFRELCKENDYTFYVENSAPPALHLFPIGDASEYLDGNGGRADVDLDSVANSITNNILDYKEGEKWGSKLWNYIELTSTFVQDHWTDENASDYTKGANTTITDEQTTKYTTYWRGRGAIKALRDTSNGVLLMTLDFSGTRYEYTVLNLKENTVLSYLLYCAFNQVDAQDPRVIRPRLEDTSGNVIEFLKHVAYLDPATKHDRTEKLTNGDWYKVRVPIGDAQTISTISNVAGWAYITKISTFDWGNVSKIHWTTPRSIQTNGYIILDDLTIPTVTAKSIVSDATSITAYKKRMLPLHKPQIRSQKELDTLSASLLAKHKDPKLTLDLITEGNTSIKYTGQSLDVNAPPYGYATDTKFRILEIYHKIALKGEGETRDYEYTTSVKLIQDEVAGTQQTTNPSHLHDPWMWNLSQQQQYLKQWEQYENQRNNPWVDIFGAQDENEGDTFPDNPHDGMVWHLTAVSGAYNPGVYVYDAGTSLWVLKGITYISDAADFSTVEWPTDQMAIETRPWSSNFSLIWVDKDTDPPTGWNSFTWGALGGEGAGGTDATVAFAPSGTRTVTAGADAAVANGDYWVYWNTANNTAVWTSTYSAASGTGKGILAQVHVEDGVAPDVLLYNSYVPTLGAGSIVAHAIRSVHFSADYITGKNFQTNTGVSTSAAGVLFNSTGIAGYKGIGLANQTFALESASGYINVNGTGAFIVNAWDSVGSHWDEIGYVEGTSQAYGGLTYDLLRIRSSTGINAQAAVSISANGDTVNFYQGSAIIVSDNFTKIATPSANTIDIGDATNTINHIYTNQITAATYNGLPTGVTTFIALTDTPAAYAGNAGKMLKVDVTPDALEFTSYLYSDVILKDGSVAFTDAITSTPTAGYIMTFSGDADTGMYWANATKVFDLQADGSIGASFDLANEIMAVKYWSLDADPADDNATGIIRTVTVGESVTIGQGLYLKSDGKYWLAKADAEATMPCVCVALGTIAADATGRVLFWGAMQDTGVFAGMTTEGAHVYVSTATAGAFTETVPTTSVHIVQIVGEVEANNQIRFNFDTTYLELA